MKNGIHKLRTYREQLYEVNWVIDSNLIGVTVNKAPEEFEVYVFDVVGDPIFLKPIRVRGGSWSAYRNPIVEVDFIKERVTLEVRSKEVRDDSDAVIGTLVYVSYPKIPAIIEVYQLDDQRERVPKHRMLVLADGTPEKPLYRFNAR